MTYTDLNYIIHCSNPDCIASHLKKKTDARNNNYSDSVGSFVSNSQVSAAASTRVRDASLSASMGNFLLSSQLPETAAASTPARDARHLELMGSSQVSEAESMPSIAAYPSDSMGNFLSNSNSQVSAAAAAIDETGSIGSAGASHNASHLNYSFRALKPVTPPSPPSPVQPYKEAVQKGMNDATAFALSAAALQDKLKRDAAWQAQRDEQLAPFNTEQKSAIFRYIKSQEQDDPLFLHINKCGEIFCATCIQLHATLKKPLGKNQLEQSIDTIASEYKLLWLVLLVNPMIAKTFNPSIPQTQISADLCAPFWNEASEQNKLYNTLLNTSSKNSQSTAEIQTSPIQNLFRRFIFNKRLEIFVTTMAALKIEHFVQDPSQYSEFHAKFEEMLYTLRKIFNDRAKTFNPDRYDDVTAQYEAASFSIFPHLAIIQEIINQTEFLGDAPAFSAAAAAAASTSTPARRNHRATVFLNEVEVSQIRRNSTESVRSTNTSPEIVAAAPPPIAARGVIDQATQLLNQNDSAIHRELQKLIEDYKKLPVHKRDAFGWAKYVFCCCSRENGTGENALLLPTRDPSTANPQRRDPNHPNWQLRTVGRHRQVGTWLIILIVLILLGIALLIKPFGIIPFPHISY